MEDIQLQDINQVMEQSHQAFLTYRKLSERTRADFMRSIAALLARHADELVETAGEETNLPAARLHNELKRTQFQLTSYADACEKGDWMMLRKVAATGNSPSFLKRMVPLGPVVVFGAANFPFAYSTAGGDTASALAAGCTVVVKAHPAHPRTGEKVAALISQASNDTQVPLHTFQHVYGASFEVGKTLVEHPLTKAVGFTGSLAGGRQLFDLAQQRPAPIPFFAEMSSINPIFILPEKLKQNPEELAKICAASVTLGVGQFCTNPGVIVVPKIEELRRFIKSFETAIADSIPAEMLHTGIFQNYVEKRANALAQEDVELLAISSQEALYNQGIATLSRTTADTFIKNKLLHQEVFGPFTILVECEDDAEMLSVAQQMEGQLTASIMATNQDLENNSHLVEAAIDFAGRIVLNSVPTGVEVTPAMMHGGPYPASTDSRFTAVGADAILRFVRPVCFQNWTEEQLPLALTR